MNFIATKIALLWDTNDTLLNMKRQRVTLLVVLDLSTAFDTVDHTILLDRLHTHFGISGHAHFWFKCYLHHRFQSISIHGGTSKRFEVKYSVPHGSCLGPLSFVLYASKLFTIIERHLPDVRAHADDTLLYISFNVNSGEEQSVALENMQRQRLEAI